MPFVHCATFRICWRTSSPHLRKISQVPSLLRKKHQRTMLMEFVEPLLVYLFVNCNCLGLCTLCACPFRASLKCDCHFYPRCRFACLGLCTLCACPFRALCWTVIVIYPRCRFACLGLCTLCACPFRASLKCDYHFYPRCRFACLGLCTLFACPFRASLLMIIAGWKPKDGP